MVSRVVSNVLIYLVIVAVSYILLPSCLIHASYYPCTLVTTYVVGGKFFVQTALNVKFRRDASTRQIPHLNKPFLGRPQEISKEALSTALIRKSHRFAKREQKWVKGRNM